MSIDVNRFEISNRIKSIRFNLHMTQDQFAEMCNIDLSTYKRAESGLSKISIDTIIAICDATNITADYILFGDRIDTSSNLYLMLSSFFHNTNKMSIVSIQNFLNLLLNAIQNQDSFDK